MEIIPYLAATSKQALFKNPAGLACTANERFGAARPAGACPEPVEGLASNARFIPACAIACEESTWML